MLVFKSLFDKKGKKQHFSWVTDFTLTKENVKSIMRGGRARWRIENNTFNTLKNQGYEFEHNFGHGYKNLSTNVIYLMMLAFLSDQLQGLGCPNFKRAYTETAHKTLIRLWEYIKSLYTFFKIQIESFEMLFGLMYEQEKWITTSRVVHPP